MQLGDLDAADRLRDQAGWNQTLGDWERMLCWQPGGCFVAENQDGVVGTVTTTTYDGRLAWLGMMLVEQALRRQGVGRALFEHALEWLERTGVATVALDATPLGKAMYDQAGFSDLYTLQRRHAVVSELSPERGVRPMLDDDIVSIAELDAGVFFGLDRLRVLTELRTAHPSGAWVKPGSNGDIEGYVLSKPGARAWYIGPLVARDAGVAETLLRAALAPLAGQSAILDTPDSNPHAAELAARYGFEARRPFIRMTRGVPPPASRTDSYFAMAGPEIG
jgi:GNAT superfamily N-acetyltransferase